MLDIWSIPSGEYDRVIQPSEDLVLYEGSRFVRFFKDKFAAIKYGTKSNPRIRGNCISYMDNMGRLITEEVTAKELESKEIIETIIKKISVPTRWEVIASVEVTIKHKNEKGEIKEHTRMYYPSEEDYNNKETEPRLKEIILFDNSKSYLRKTVERFLNEDEIKKRFEMGGITLSPFAPDNVKKEMLETKTIYTVDRQKINYNLPESLKNFGNYTETKEKEIRYIKDDKIKPENEDFVEYIGPTEIERDVILFKNDEPKARIEQNDEIIFKNTRTHKIKSKIVNYPNKEGHYGDIGRGTYASYDNKVLYATGSQSIDIKKTKDGKLGYAIEKNGDKSVATVEIKGTEILISIKNKEQNPEEFAKSILKTFKTEWNVKSSTKAKYVTNSTKEPIPVDCKFIQTTNCKAESVTVNKTNNKKKK